MESSSIFGAEKMEPNDFENNERALVALRDDDAAAFCIFTNRDEMPREYGCGPLTGFLFVAEKYRGNRLSEKYSFTKVGDYKTMYGSVDQLFSKTL
mgnify:FL=1